MRAIVLDTETSGLKEPMGVCECAFIEFHPDTLEQIAQHHSLIDPQVPISSSASGIHRITDDMVQDQPTLAEWFEIVLNSPFTVPPQDVIMVAHNAAFDHPLVAPYLGNSRTLCTYKLAVRLYPNLENHKLATMKYEFKLGKGGHSHSALADVEDCLDLLRKMVEDSGMNLMELLEFQNKPRVIEIMPFSKDHKGKPLSEVPRSFWQWLIRKGGDVDPDLAYSVNLIHPDLFKPKE